MSSYDHVVVGAGIVGSWTALHLRKLGKNVLLLEQFSEPHSRGSSHGQTRVTRSGYAEVPLAQLMPHAHDIWADLEKETGRPFILKTGAINFVPDRDYYNDCVSNMRRYSPQHLQLMDSIPEKYSRLLHYDDPGNFFFDKSSGIILAHKALLTVQELFKKHGGHLWDRCKVSRVTPDGDKVIVSTSKGDVTASSVVVCAGTWTKSLLAPDLVPSLPLQPTMVKVYYWKVKEKGAYSYGSGFPILLDYNDPLVYSLPCYEYPDLVKVCVHGGVPCDPDARDRTTQDPKLENYIKDFIKKHFILLEPEPAIIETCMYTLTPDEMFLMDHLPKYKNIIVGTGFSGTGFKTSPVVGKLLSQMATGKEPFLDISAFRLDRFSKG